MDVQRIATASLGFVVGSLLVVPQALAEPWVAGSGLHGAGLGMSEDARGRAWLDVALFTNEQATVVSPILGAGFLVAPTLELELAVPASVDTSDNGGALLGNPYVGVSYVSDGPSVRLKLGGGIALPVVSIDDFDQLGALVGGLGTRGMQESWFWFEDALPVVLPLRLEAPVGSPGLFTLDAAVALITPIGDRDKSELVLQVAPGVAAHAGDSLILGTRLTTFFVPTAEGDDDTQLALEPFLRVDGPAFFFATRFTLNLDEPLGFAFDQGKIWGLHVGLGGAF